MKRTTIFADERFLADLREIARRENQTMSDVIRAALEEFERTVLGCVQFSSAAWRMAVRERWIGWDEQTRRRNLQRVVNNSRFLILPWVRVPNLASRVLSLAARRLSRDWAERYGVAPLLVETLVDPSRYTGNCYRAANWMQVGVTTGRGRMDRERLREGAAPKLVFVYPLVRGAARRLREV